jgi:hypothetical protein
MYDNGRITIMFCSFDADPKIVRLFGKGTVYEVFAPYDSVDIVWDKGV